MRYFFALGVRGAKNKRLTGGGVQRPVEAPLHLLDRRVALALMPLIVSACSPEELRAEIAKRVVLLRDKGYVDLEALPPPANKEVAIADAEGDEEDHQEGSD
jgi:hypothetical protein